MFLNLQSFIRQTTNKPGMKVTVYIFTLILFISNLYAKGENVEKILDEANRAYINEEYKYAEEQYEKIIDMGYASPSLYYNLGNSYFMEEKFGPAILYYERAKRLDPSNKDILHNLKIANSRIVDKVEPVPELFYKKWWRNLLTMKNSNEWAITGIILTVCFFISLSVYLLSKSIKIKKFTFYTALIILLLNAFSLIFAYRSYQIQIADNYAIVMSIRTTAKSAPSETSPDVFVIHEGAKVKTSNKIGEWVEIKLENGSVGWIKEDAIEII